MCFFFHFLIGGWPTTEGFVVISRSKLNQYQDDLLYVRVIISSRIYLFLFFYFFSCDTAKYGYHFLIGGWPKTEGFVVISRSKLNQYQDDLLDVRVIISSRFVLFSFFFSFFPFFLFMWYRKIWSTLSVRFVVACSSRLAGSDNTYTSVSYFTVSHPNLLRKLYLSLWVYSAMLFSGWLFYGIPLVRIVLKNKWRNIACWISVLATNEWLNCS